MMMGLAWIMCHEEVRAVCKKKCGFLIMVSKVGGDVLMNNLSESFNSSILIARDKPIITMMEWIRSYIMGRFASLRHKCSLYTANVMPKPQKRLDKEIEKSANWIPAWAGGKV